MTIINNQIFVCRECNYVCINEGQDSCNKCGSILFDIYIKINGDDQMIGLIENNHIIALVENPFNSLTDDQV